MNIEVTDAAIIFADVDAFRREFIRRLPEAAAPDDEASRCRIFPPPCADAADESTADWKEIVEPELRALFSSHVDMVAGDIAGMAEGGALSIPLAHADAWIHTLNQARLAVGARHDVTEEDMEDILSAAEPEKLLALIQIDIYGGFLAVLLDVTE